MTSSLASQKPLLTKNMMVKRLQFAKKYKTWIAEAWSKIRISYELTFSCIRATRSRVRRPKNIIEDYYMQLNDSMPKKMRIIVQGKGDMTKY